MGDGPDEAGQFAGDDAQERHRLLDTQITRAEGAVREFESRLSDLGDQKERLHREERATEAQLESEQGRLAEARARREVLANDRTAMGGVLLVDNPFGKVTHPLFLRTQRELARAMDVQLVFTTNVKDFDPVGEFPHVVKTVKDERELRSGRALVHVSRHWITEPGPVAEKEAKDRPPRVAAE